MNNKNNEHSIRKIETNGVEQTPDHERTAGPNDPRSKSMDSLAKPALQTAA